MKSSEHGVIGFTYAVGEEVAARIEGVDVYSVEHASLLPAPFRPHWTIATIMERVTRDTHRCYAICFLVDDAPHIALVPEDAVDGTV